MNPVVGENATDFHLIWVITHAFAPWDRQENNLFLRAPDPCCWYVELLSLSLIAKNRRFLCSLGYDTRFGPEATADTFEITVTLNGNSVHRNRVFDYTFNQKTRYVYSFEVEINGHDECNNLGILVYIDPKRQGIGGARALDNGAEIQLLIGGESADMDSLSLALYRSLQRPSYNTLSMFSKENKEFPVHHYILQERWKNLFTVHNLNEDSNSVSTNISFLVLCKILCYMYSGVVMEGIMWNIPKCVAEFFQVVRGYQIVHLYEALRQSNERVSQTGINYVDSRRITFELRFFRDIDLGERTVPFPIHVYPYNVSLQGSRAHNFLLLVHGRYHSRAGAWLSYSVRSQTEVNFKLNIELEIKENEGSTKLVHASKYSIPGRERIASGPILFLGCPETFRHAVLSEGTESGERLLFGLTFIDGISSANIWHLSIARDFSRNPKEILSQHMRSVQHQQVKTDLVVQPRGNLGGFGVQSYRIHKEIFIARLPGWRNVVQPRLQEDEDLPDVVTLPLTNESFQHVVSYMYTGTTFRIPMALRPEISHFALESGFESLQRIL